MPMIGWLFILAAFAMIVGSLLLLRDGANMKIPKEKLEKIKSNINGGINKSCEQIGWGHS